MKHTFTKATKCKSTSSSAPGAYERISEVRSERREERGEERGERRMEGK